MLQNITLKLEKKWDHNQNNLVYLGDQTKNNVSG